MPLGLPRLASCVDSDQLRRNTTDVKHTKQIPDHLLDKEIYLKLISHTISITLILSIIDNIIRAHYFLLAIDIYVILSVNFGTYILFQRFHYFISARLLILSSGMLAASVASLITGAKYHNEHYVLVLIAISFLIFHQSERKWSFISAVVSAGLYLVLIQFPDPTLPFDRGNWTDSSRLVNQFSYVIFLILALMGLSKSYDKAVELFSSQKKRWQTLSEASPVGVFRVNLKSEIVYSNPQFNAFIGRSEFDKIGLAKVFSAQTASNLEHWKKQNYTDSFFEEIVIEKSEGQKVSGQLYLRADLDENKKVLEYIGVMIDVTQQRELEAKLVESSKMASLGRMAGAIAHEISNPISVIKLQMSLLMRKASERPLSTEELKKAESIIVGTLDRMGQITHGLRIVARDQRFSEKSIKSIESIFFETLPFCQERFKQVGVRLEFFKEPKEHFVYANSVEISQVIVNLLNNAIDAIEGLAEKKISIQIQSEGQTVVTKITDSGHIEPALANKIMDPFFTTKAVGKGTGLGLTISQSIVENHKGSLYLNRESEKTQFIMQLPLVEVPEKASI